MAFKKRRRTQSGSESPESLFRDLRGRKVQGLLSQQADVLRDYAANALDASDVAFQLPTGSGKTLVGLLLAEWRRVTRKERVVFLCPTRQLVNQVALQASQSYGIHVNAFTGSKKHYSREAKAEFTNAEAIAVTPYSSLFNIRPFFEHPDIIVLDDAHAAENYVAEHWTLRVNRRQHATLFRALASCMKGALTHLDYARLTESSTETSDLTWGEKLPSPVLEELSQEIADVIEEHQEDKEIGFRWRVLQDHLHACNLFLSSQEMLLRPLIPPTRTHPPFAGATQRIYMSATLGEGGELERMTGVKKIHRIAAPKDLKRQGIGRRLFMFPERSLKPDEVDELCSDLIDQAGRAVVLAPSDRAAKQFTKLVEERLPEHVLLTAHELEETKDTFVQEDKAVVIVANRYDGIDLTGDECRLLLISGLPRAVNLQEHFLITRMGASVLYTERVITRIVQAVGRCTRAATDFAAVVVLDDALNTYLLHRDNRHHLPPELQAELEFGIDQSKGVAKQDFLDNFTSFLNQDSDWKEADKDIIGIRTDATTKEFPGSACLRKAVKHEIEYQYDLWKKDYERALESARAVLTELTAPELGPYRAFWNYLAGSAAAHAAHEGKARMQTVAAEYFEAAGKGCLGVSWLVKLPTLVAKQGSAGASGQDNELIAVVERLERQLERLGTANDRSFNQRLKRIGKGLRSDDADKFEAAQRLLGETLGYEADNRKDDSAPDPWWIATEDLCVVFEDHSGAKSAEGEIGSNKVRQAASHPAWIRKNTPVNKDAEIVPVLVSPRQAISQEATAYAGDTCYWNLDEFVAWADAAMDTVRSLRRTFAGVGDLEWRLKAMQTYEKEGLGPHQLVDQLRNRPLSSLVPA